MPDNLYEIISLAMRYWFTALGALIVWRAFSWLRKDRRLKHKRLRTLPDAGMIGEMVVLEGSRDLPEETLISVPREGVLGFLRACDLVVPVTGVSNQHADFVFVPGKGLLVIPRRGCECQVDGHEIRSHRDAKRYPMGHNSVLEIGEAVLRLRLFAGLDAPHRPLCDEDEPLPPDPLQAQDEGLPPENSLQSLYPPQRSPYAPAGYPQDAQPYGPLQPYPQQGQPYPVNPPCPLNQLYGPEQPYPQGQPYSQHTQPYSPVLPSPYASPPAWSPFPSDEITAPERPQRRRRYDDDE